MQIKKNNHKNNKIQLAICYQSNAWRRYSQILIWKCSFPFSSLTRCSHKKADSTVMDPLSAEIWRKLVPRERDNSMNVILQRPILRLSHNNSDIPRVKCISRGRKRKELGNEVEIWTHWLRMTQGTLERGGGGGRNVQLLQNYTCYKSTSHKFSKTSEASLNEIAQDNQPGNKNYRTLRKSTTKRVELPCCASLAKKRQVVVSCEILLQKVESSSTFCNKTCTSVVDPGEGPKGPGPSPLILRPKWGPKGRKKIFLRPPPPSISGSGWWPGTPLI